MEDSRYETENRSTEEQQTIPHNGGVGFTEEKGLAAAAEGLSTLVSDVHSPPAPTKEAQGQMTSALDGGRETPS